MLFARQFRPAAQSAVRQLASSLRPAYLTVAYYAMLILFGLVCLAVSLPATLLGLLMPTDRSGPYGRRMIQAAFRVFLAAARASGVLRCNDRSLDVLRWDRPLIIAPNHPSILDAVFVLARLPEAVCLMKAPIWDNVFLGGGARFAGYIRNDAPLPMVRSAARALKSGQQLLIFPEGTRTRSGPVEPFTGGFALIAKATGVAVQTLIIESNIPTGGWRTSLLKPPPLPLTYRLRLGRRFEQPCPPHALVRDVEAYVRREIART
ncbi:lysophospholipid acyltransferase family protein [Marinivivus vitaminiproducens]|uniref:lysophospholipid acyltransferase family protein n=1 Tax=Marinivivus vitaminiproducens TaxID=3035935 RepID=UPI00279D57F5|nr:lysophospholipid acyltransferase family protein [Geminicoccaceae bacterium SCSIO 64248]